MTKTLYIYISRDLGRLTIMALLAFTTVMTVFGVVEPMRRQGLNGTQIMLLFGYTIPVMLSLTFPIAALFAATFVYGRFRQANELLAAKASGVSAISLLKPALVLGMIMTVISLVLNNFVAPEMVNRGTMATKANIEGLVYQQLRTKSYVKIGTRIIHAADVTSDGRVLHLRGVVAADISDANNVPLVAAPEAYVHFVKEGGQNYATLQLIDSVGTKSADHSIMKLGDIAPTFLLPRMAKEQPTWYDWNQLCAILKDPSKNTRIRLMLTRIRHQACSEMHGRRILSAIKTGKSHRLTDGVQYDYLVASPFCARGKTGEVRLASTAKKRVKVSVERNGNLRKTITADRGKIVTAWSRRSKEMKVTLQLNGNVSIRVGTGDEGAEPSRRSEWSVGVLRIPDDIDRKSRNIDMDKIYRNASAYTSNKALLRALKYRIAKTRMKIKAEMHGRIAYSLSCCLLVAMGAALGLIFGGGQIISAFAISIVPALLAIVLIFMGKELAANPGVNSTVGLASIWSGLVLLLGGNIYIYGRLMRR